MKFKVSIPTLVAAVAGVSSMFLVDGVRAGVETAIGNDVTASEMRAITVESWDRDYSNGGYGWELLTDKDTRTQGAYQPAASNLQAEREVKLIKGTPADIRENLGFDGARILGVKFAFTFSGYNVVTIRPPAVDQYIVERPRPYLNELALAENYKARSCYQNPALSSAVTTQRAQMVDCVVGVNLPGVVSKISVWVLGRGNEYDLEGWVEDWKGNTHIYKFGSIDFIGWRPMTIDIPKNVPQDVSSYPQVKTLVFRQFKLRSNPQTSLETVYIFFDELRILTNIFEVNFDGNQVDFDRADCEQKNRLIKLIQSSARRPDLYQPKDCSTAPGPAAPIANQPGQ
ncbi:flagellar filament outer layer protein FlaA [Leptonema illini]|uniref:Flagellar filament outer layer protein FlaA n=1 Tax=Leptonema illini DSM 21528 TaxID=929563 RepID=H2CAT7_9LEPT|nr:flagellar filament outer layer protein FlaA [Leptonema illini]EHQ08465.1 flagellar filament outer layer protein FlaA [Leptonema illini DSM 21528]